MNPRLILFSLVLFLSGSMFGQQIESVKGNRKSPYALAGEKLSFRELDFKLSKVPEAVRPLKKAKTQRVLATTTSLASGIILGYQAANLINERREVNTGMVAGGTLLFLGSILIGGGSERNYAEAINIYNAQRGGPGMGLNLGLGVTRNGLGLLHTF